LNKAKIVLLVIATTVLGGITTFINSFVSVQCTEVSMMTARNPMGPIWYYKQMANFCQFGNSIVVLGGLFLIGLTWYLAYRKTIQNLNQENL
jgi:hypothetical protein